jgi:hypothetical protein
MHRAYEEIINFIAAGSTPTSVASWRPSQAARERVAQLLHQRKGSTLSGEDEAELNHFLELEHIMRLAKVRARQHLP